MIMIIAIIYIFLSYVIFDQQLKITFRKSSTHPPIEKIHSPFLLGGGRTLWLEVDPRKILNKVYNVINCLNKNLITQLFDILKKK